MNRRALSIAVVAVLLLLSAVWAQQHPAAHPPATTTSEPSAKGQEPARERKAGQGDGPESAGEEWF